MPRRKDCSREGRVVGILGYVFMGTSQCFTEECVAGNGILDKDSILSGMKSCDREGLLPLRMFRYEACVVCVCEAIPRGDEDMFSMVATFE